MWLRVGRLVQRHEKTVGREIGREESVIRSKPRILAANWVGWLSLITAVDSWRQLSKSYSITYMSPPSPPAEVLLKNPVMWGASKVCMMPNIHQWCMSKRNRIQWSE